ncbi:outer membrane protein [Desulfovibrionales bacterium]
MCKISLFTLALCLFLSGQVGAEEVNLGFVNVEKILTTCDPCKLLKAKMEIKIKDLKSKMEQPQKELQKLQDELKNQSVVLTQEAKMSKNEEFRKKLMEVQNKSQIYQQQLIEEEQKMIKPIQDVLIDVVTKYGQENHYTMIIESRNAGVMYAAAHTDLTQKMLEEFHKAWKLKGNKP